MAAVCQRHQRDSIRACSRCQSAMCGECATWGARLGICPECPLNLRPGAGVGRRLLAHLIDVGLFFVPTLLVIIVGLVIGMHSALTPRRFSEVPLGEALNGWALLFALFVPVIVQAAMQFVKGRSLGKWLLGLRVIDDDGTPMDPVRVILLRNAIPLLVSGVCGLFPLVDVVMFLMPPHQRWRDKHLHARVIEDPR